MKEVFVHKSTWRDSFMQREFPHIRLWRPQRNCHRCRPRCQVRNHRPFRSCRSCSKRDT
jgi:hypothetical protein